MTVSAHANHAQTSETNGAITPTQPVVALEQISRVYGTGEAMVRACDRMNLTIQRGEYCAIMGDPGSR